MLVDELLKTMSNNQNHYPAPSVVAFVEQQLHKAQFMTATRRFAISIST